MKGTPIKNDKASISLVCMCAGELVYSFNKGFLVVRWHTARQDFEREERALLSLTL